MSKKSIFIIGAGYSGLSAGIFGQRAGFNTKIFEHNHVAGGVAASWRQGQYLFDVGTHYIMGYRPGKGGSHEILEPLGITDPNLYTPMKSFKTYIDERYNVKINMDINVDKFGAELLEKAPADKKFIHEFIKGIHDFEKYYPYGFPDEKPREMEGMVDKAMFYFRLRKVLRYFAKDNSRPVRECVKDLKTPWLRAMISSGFHSEVPMWFLYMLLGCFSLNQTGHIKDGCGKLVSTLENNYKSLGGEIKFNSTVSKILVKNGKACGVKLKNGQEYTSDYVISAGDGEMALYKLLEGKYLTPALDKRYKTIPTCRPFFYANYGVNKDFSDKPTYTTLELKKPIEYGPNKVTNMKIRIFNYGNFAPKGKTTLQGMYTAEPGYWENLRKKDASEYLREKERVGNEILDRMEAHYPGIKANIEKSSIATPYTTIRYTLNKHGSWGGWEFRDEIFKNKINQTLPGLKNFYLIGHWGSCGGVIPCFFSGRSAIKLITNGY